jgi:hypothetical protein
MCDSRKDICDKGWAERILNFFIYYKRQWWS